MPIIILRSRILLSRMNFTTLREPAFISLKTKAFLNNAARKAAGQSVRQDDIDKHKRDVIRLAAALTPGDPIDTPPPIKADIQQYVDVIRREGQDARQILRSSNINTEQILELLVQTFGLEN